MSPVIRAAIEWGRIYTEVEQRLEAAGAVAELDHLRHMSQSELDLLVRRERDNRWLP